MKYRDVEVKILGPGVIRDPVARVLVEKHMIVEWRSRVFNGIVKLSAAAAALMIVAIPALASAQGEAYSASSPVAITSFKVNEMYESGVSAGDVTDVPQFVVNAIALKFANQSDTPVTAVKFLVTEGKNTQSIVDKGTFSPGVQIEHNFAVHGDQLTNAATCKVAEVDFADGSIWHVDRSGIANR